MANPKYSSKIHRTIKRGTKGNDVRDLQRAANFICSKHGFDWRVVPVDGDCGPLTIKAVHFAGWLYGLRGKELKRIMPNTGIGKVIQRRLRHQKRRAPIHVVLKARRKKKRKRLRKLHKKRAETGLVMFDGVWVAAWIGHWLVKSRQAGWKGTAISGYRDPAYSEQLCYQMCGAPRCPGRCGGRYSNHAGKGINVNGDAGAVDVTDYVNFGRIQRQIGSPLKNTLGAQDPGHFSFSGN